MYVIKKYVLKSSKRLRIIIIIIITLFIVNVFSSTVVLAKWGHSTTGTNLLHDF